MTDYERSYERFLVEQEKSLTEISKSIKKELKKLKETNND